MTVVTYTYTLHYPSTKITVHTHYLLCYFPTIPFHCGEENTTTVCVFILHLYKAKKLPTKNKINQKHIHVFIECTQRQQVVMQGSGYTDIKRDDKDRFGSKNWGRFVLWGEHDVTVQLSVPAQARWIKEDLNTRWLRRNSHKTHFSCFTGKKRGKNSQRKTKE